jgi:hypothetical protein
VFHTQFYWQDYSDKRYLQALHLLASFRAPDRDAYYPNSNLGGVRIGGIGLVNFDSARVDEICDSLGSGVVLTNQVQVGGRDRRARGNGSSTDQFIM